MILISLGSGSYADPVFLDQISESIPPASISLDLQSCEFVMADTPQHLEFERYAPLPASQLEAYPECDRESCSRNDLDVELFDFP